MSDNQEPNAWAVMHENHRGEWVTSKWFPSINIDTINGKPLDEEDQWDMGQARAAQAALMNELYYGTKNKVRFVHFAPFDSDHGVRKTYEGVQ